MTKQEIIRAWKDEEYRRGFDSHTQALIPENPAGAIELLDAELNSISGGTDGGCASPTPVNLSLIWSVCPPCFTISWGICIE
jgi:mersacidin/lichenicidin family type 2 lantibiotic